jgi:CubicO group peptidase (beta-lactamase class C family)
VLTEAGKNRDVASVGSYSWGGFFYTYFWVDPQKELIGVLMTQLYPAGHLSLRNDFKKRAYESLAD